MSELRHASCRSGSSSHDSSRSCSTLRGPDGCPWDREQTIDSLKPFVLEETYEVLEAIDRHDHAALCEELGDFVFEAVFVAQLEAEAGRFTIATRWQSVADKLVRRHPHVFARGSRERRRSIPPARSGRAGRRSRRGAERRTGRRRRCSSGIAPTLPALLRAFHIGTRAASVGFDWSGPGDVVEKMQEEVDELREVVDAPGRSTGRAPRRRWATRSSRSPIWSRKLGVEPETALRKAKDKFTRRFGTLEQAIAASGRAMKR